MADSARETTRLTYSLADTHKVVPSRPACAFAVGCPGLTWVVSDKFEFATSCASLSTIFGSIARNSEPLALRDWGIANTTLEEAFIKIAKESNSLQ